MSRSRPRRSNREPSQAEIDRYAEIAKRYTPPGVRVIIRKNPGRYKTSGTAYPNRTIASIAPDTRGGLLTFLHECGHHVLGHFKKDRPAVVEEYEAERWAIDTMRREGVKVPADEIREAKIYVASFINGEEKLPYRVRRWLGELGQIR